jgi:hypothetical protein
MNVAGMTQVLPRAMVRLTTANTGAPTDPGSNVHYAVWGNTAGVKPVVARSSAGVFTITWPTTVTDALAVVHTLALFTGWANVEGATYTQAEVTITSANVATLRTFNAAGSVADTTGVTITVFVR